MPYQDEPEKFLTHDFWCEYWWNDETEVCTCGYREDLCIDAPENIARE